MSRLICLLFVLLPMCVWAGRYRIDPTHTAAYFATDHLGFSIQRGRFDRLSGSLDIDLDEKTGQIEVSIDASSLSSGDETRDKRLKGSSFFNVEQFPTLQFSGKQFDWRGDDLVGIKGELTLLGVVKPVTLSISRFKCGFHLFDLARACGAEAKTTIKRSDFGMDSWLSFVGDEVEITIQIEAIHE